jgi:hypothetical protein
LRSVLTIVAVALVALLSAALFAPILVDWSAHRAEIESKLGALAGAKVNLTGPITIRLLPSPYLETGAGSISGGDQDAPRLSFESARLEVALVKLVSGAIRFADIELGKPVLTISRSEDGALRLPSLPTARSETVGFDHLVVQDGRVQVAARGAAMARKIADVQLTADGLSLAGPFHVSGQFSGPAGAPVVFRLATERGGPMGTPLRLSVDRGVNWPALEFDGALAGPGLGAKSPSLSGSGTLVGTVPGVGGPTPWRAIGRMTADLDQTTLESARLTFGPEERALSAEGSAVLTYGAPIRLSIQATTKQANLDALLRSKGEDGVAPARALAFVSEAVAPALSRTALVTVEVNLAAETVILGADTVSDLSASFRSAPGAALHARFDLGLPGRSRLSADGDLETGAAAKFDGTMDFNSEDFALLRKWANPEAPGGTDNLVALGKALADRSVSLSGHAEVSAVGFSGRDVKITLDRSTLTGSLAFTSPVGGDPGRLYVDLSSDLLDVDALPTIETGKSLIGDLDLSLSLRAKSFHVARVSDAEIDSGSLALKVTKSGPNITLDRLSVADLGGAFLDAQGAVGPNGFSATGRLRADRLQDLALLAARLAPGELSQTMVERAALFSPTTLTFEGRGGQSTDGGPVINSLKASGSIGQTQATLNLEPTGKDNRPLLTVSLDSSDSGVLLSQLGLHGSGSAGGRGHIGFQALGGWTAGYEIDATAALAGADLSGHGRFMPTAEADDPRFVGSVKLKGPNIAPLFVALGLEPTGGPIGPVDAGADVMLQGDRWTASRFAATIAGVKGNGSLVYQPSPEPGAPATADAAISQGEDALGAVSPQAPRPPEITGDLTLDRLPLSDLLAFSLGTLRPSRVGAGWSDSKFTAPPLNPPPLAMRINVGTLDLVDGLSSRAFSATLRLDRGRLDLDDIAMTIAQGAASGRMTLRRDRETVTLTGSLIADKLAIAKPGFSGKIGGNLDFASTGRSAEGLIEGLAGSGIARFAGAALTRSDPEALDRVVAKAQAPDAALDETNIAYVFGNELNKTQLPIPDGAVPVALTSGVMKLGPVAIARPHGEATLSAELDLRKLALKTRLGLVSNAAGLKFWSGRPPGATATVEDVLDEPKRRLDVSSLSAGLATQAIARETDRIATLEADIRERAFFNRRLKGERFMDQRAAEVQDWRAEQARLKGLAEHLAEQEKAEAEKAAAEKAAAEKAAAEKAAAEKAAAEKAAAARLAAEKLTAEKAAAAKAAAAERAGEKLDPQPDIPTDVPPGGIPAPRAQSAPNDSSARADQLGANAPLMIAPAPPSRPKPRSAPPPDPTASGLY